MVTAEVLPDDEPVRMTVNERMVWASLVAVVVSSGVYAALMVSRLLRLPVAEISWAGPMLWTLGLSVAGSIALSIVFAIVAEAARGRRAGAAGAAGAEAVRSDVRDREIGRLGWRVSMMVISVGSGAALVLAMLDARTFWIGNLLFLFGAAGAVVEGITKLRLYRRGF